MGLCFRRGQALVVEGNLFFSWGQLGCNNQLQIWFFLVYYGLIYRWVGVGCFSEMQMYGGGSCYGCFWCIICFFVVDVCLCILCVQFCVSCVKQGLIFVLRRVRLVIVFGWYRIGVSQVQSIDGVQYQEGFSWLKRVDKVFGEGVIRVGF